MAAELGRIERNRARDAAREAELILRLAELRPDTDDPPPGTPGARRALAEDRAGVSGVSEFFPDELAHALTSAGAPPRSGPGGLHVAGGPAGHVRRAAPREIDERRAGVLADALQHASRARQGGGGRAAARGARPVPGRAAQAGPAAAGRAGRHRDGERHEEAQRTADVRVRETRDGMATLAGDLTAEEAAACPR